MLLAAVPGQQRLPATRGKGTPMSLIEVRDIGKTYGSVIALRDVSTVVNAGEVTCVLATTAPGSPP